MKRFSSIGPMCLALVLVLAVAMIGCRRSVPPEGLAGTTTPGSDTPYPEIDVDIPSTPEVPDDTPTIPDDTPTIPDDTPTIPDDTPTIPDDTPTIPDSLGVLVPVDIKLPAPAFRGTPVPTDEPNVEQPKLDPRSPFFAPKGTANLAGGKPVACSDPAPASGEIDFVTDGDKEASDFGYLELRPGSQWVQVDLGGRATIWAVLFWHSHAEARVYRDVIVQVSDDPDFLEAQTVFNNDYDNSSGQGIGADRGYVETSEGKLVDCQGVEGRYVRLYSKGNHIDEKNHYTEIEVFGIR